MPALWKKSSKNKVKDPPPIRNLYSKKKNLEQQCKKKEEEKTKVARSKADLLKKSRIILF